jgi:hypothetical protein
MDLKHLTPEQQGFIVKAGLIVAAIGPVILIVGQLATSICISRYNNTYQGPYLQLLLL